MNPLRLIAMAPLLLVGSTFASETPAPKTSPEINNLAVNGGFEEAEGWKLIPRNKAEGSITQSKETYSGEHSLLLTKTNSDGYLQLRSERPIRVKRGVTYTFSGRYRAENAPISSLLLFRIGPSTSPLQYDSIDRSAGWSSQSFVINAPSGRWEKRAITYRADRDRDVYLSIVAIGNPFSVKLDELKFSAGLSPVVTADPAAFDFPHTVEEVHAILEQREASTAELKGSTLFVEGKATAPVLYKGLESSGLRGDYEAMGKAGVPLSITAVRLGPSSAYEDTLWRGKKEYDLAVIDRALISVLRKNPNARIVIDLNLFPYPQWGDEHPEECILNKKGEIVRTKIFNHSGSVPADTRPLFDPKTGEHGYPSFHSKVWREDLTACLEAITQHLKASPYGKSVAGFFLTWGQDGQFINTGSDDSAPGRTAFHHWLKQRFGTILALNESVGSDYSSFETVEVPNYDLTPKEAIEQGPPYAPGLHPLYGEFKEETAWELRDYLAGQLKEKMERPVIAIAYGTPISSSFYATRHLDGAGSMTYYPFRNPGYSAHFRPGNGPSFHQKLLFQEIDLRSYVGSQYREVYQLWIGAGDTPERWQAINRQLVGASLANNYGYWYYDMGNYYADPEIRRQIKQTLQVAEQVYEKNRELAVAPNAFRPEVAVIAGDVSDTHQGNRYLRSLYRNASATYQTVLRSAGWMLDTSGVPYDYHLLDDILQQPALQNYKVYIFMQSPYLSAEQREKIKTLLANRGRTIIWLYDTGYLTEKSASTEHQKSLTGFNIRTSESLTRQKMQLTDSQGPYTRGVLPLQGFTELLNSIFATNGGGEYGSPYQPFWIEDSDATVIGKYSDTDQAAAGVKKFKDWTSIYLAAPNSLGNDFLNRIASEAGAYVAGPHGESLVMNGGFVSLHARTTRTYPFALPPGKTTLRDAFTGEKIPVSNGIAQLSLTAQETYWFILE